MKLLKAFEVFVVVGFTDETTGVVVAAVVVASVVVGVMVLVVVATGVVEVAVGVVVAAVVVEDVSVEAEVEVEAGVSSTFLLIKSSRPLSMPFAISLLNSCRISLSLGLAKTLEALAATSITKDNVNMILISFMPRLTYQNQKSDKKYR